MIRRPGLQGPLKNELSCRPCFFTAYRLALLGVHSGRWRRPGLSCQTTASRNPAVGVTQSATLIWDGFATKAPPSALIAPRWATAKPGHPTTGQCREPDLAPSAGQATHFSSPDRASYRPRCDFGSFNFTRRSPVTPACNSRQRSRSHVSSSESAQILKPRARCSMGSINGGKGPSDLAGPTVYNQAVSLGCFREAHRDDWRVTSRPEVSPLRSAGRLQEVLSSRTAPSS
jgi:hypothetical protein